MAFNFPASPTVGDTYQQYVWDGEKWVVRAGSGGGGGSGSSPLTTRGDMLYRNATMDTRLPAGSYSEFLRTGGPTSNPYWSQLPPGGYVYYAADYGVTAGSAADQSGAMQTLLTQVGTTGGKVVFPAGTITCLSAVTLSIPANKAVMIVGQGLEVTIFDFPNSHGLTVTFTNVFSLMTMVDMTFVTGKPGSYVGLHLYMAVAQSYESGNSQLINVSFRGSDQYGGNFYWVRAIWVNNVSYVNFYNLTVHGGANPGGSVLSGVGVLIEGSGGLLPDNVSHSYGVVYNFTNCVFNYIDQGIVYGKYVQGVTCIQCNFTAVNTGIVSQAGVAGDLDQLVVMASQFAYRNAGINAATKILIANITGCTFQPVGPNLTAFGGINGIFEAFTFVGNTFINSQSTSTTYGIVLAAGSQFGVVSGNVFYGSHGVGVLLQAGAKNTSVQSNYYFGPTQNTNPVASVPADAIVIGGGSA